MPTVWKATRRAALIPVRLVLRIPLQAKNGDIKIMFNAELLTELTPVFFVTKTDMDEYHSALILLNYFRSFESNDTVVEVLERILELDEADMGVDKTGTVYTLDPAFINKTELKTVLETAVNDSISIVEDMMLSGSLDIDGVPFKDPDIWGEDRQHNGSHKKDEHYLVELLK